VVQRGTARSLNDLGLTLAGKTGTTNDVKDTWFIGFSPDLVVGVYMGFDDPRTLGKSLSGADEEGASSALPVFREIIQAALEGQETPPFRIPPGVSMARIDRLTGRPAIGSGGDVIWEAFRPGTEPGTGYSMDQLFAPGEVAPAGMTSFGDTVPEATTGTGGLY
jgi:penicillin-binding protein 1A